MKKSLMILIYLYNSRPLDLSQDGENIVVVVEIRGFTSVAKSPVLKQASPFKRAFGGNRPFFARLSVISPVFCGFLNIAHYLSIKVQDLLKINQT